MVSQFIKTNTVGVFSTLTLVIHSAQLTSETKYWYKVLSGTGSDTNIQTKH